MGLGEKLRGAMEKLRNSTELDKGTVKEIVKELQRALISSDVEVALVLGLSKKIEAAAFKDLPAGINRREHVIKETYDLLAELLGGEDVKIPEKPGKILVVGLFGSGKTTSIGKIANYYSKRGAKVGVIAGDTFRPAAYEQLEQVAKKAGVDFYGEGGEKNAAKVVRNGLKEFAKHDLIISDSAGRSGLDAELKKEIKEIGTAFNAGHVWLVLAADTGQLAKRQAEAFHNAVGVNGVVITRMDGSAKGGGALAACSATKAPVLFLGTGEKVNDIEEFEAERYLGRIMGYGDLKALLEKARDAGAEEMDIEELMKGEFTLTVFYEQLRAARKMGPMGKVMEMMGLNQQLPQEMLEVGEEKLDGFKVMMDSMTREEKDNPDVLNKSRIARVARGSGKSIEDVRALIKNYKNMKAIFKRFNKFDEKKLEKQGLQGLLKGLGGIKGVRGLGGKKKFKIR